jgi:hypothetical protein
MTYRNLSPFKPGNKVKFAYRFSPMPLATLLVISLPARA